MTWQSYAACRDYDPELFFPVGTAGAPAYDLQVASALQVCGTCPVATECLSYALETGQEGIWGGTTDAGRQALSARLRRTERGA